jgi:tetratricopeptide (TPR) repeat protein
MDMDAISAHLDRGWDLLHRGDTSGARVSAGRILELNSGSPEGLTLMGAILAAEGAPAEAMDSLQQAIENEPKYLDAYLYAAELAIHTLGELEAGLALCKEAQPLAKELDEVIDIGLLRAEACLLGDDLEGTARWLGTTPPQLEEPGHALRAGRLHLEVGEAERAVELLEHAMGDEAARADAHYYLGVGKEQLGRTREGLSHFFEAHALDLAEPEPAWAVSVADLEGALQDVLRSMPEAVQEHLAGAVTRVADHPPLELVAEGLDPRGLLFISTQPSARGGVEVTGIFVYKRNVERLAGAREEIAETLDDALQQELELVFD